MIQSDTLPAQAKRFLIYYAVWAVLSDGRGEFLLLGVPVCLLAVVVGERIWRSGGKRIRLWSLLGYMPGFLWRSFKGGFDVGWRVLSPTLRISPAFVTYEAREDDETARVLLCDVISLMPGTLGSGMDGRRTTIHLLADEASVRDGLLEEETRVRRLFDQIEEHSP